MDLLIISAYKKEFGLLQAHREYLLARCLDTLGLVSQKGTGNDGTGEEKVLVADIRNCDNEDRVNITEAVVQLCDIFAQEYVMIIENDVMYRYDAYGGVKRIGVAWDLDDPSCPTEVKGAAVAGHYTKWCGRTIGVMTTKMANERYEKDEQEKRMSQASFEAGCQRVYEKSVVQAAIESGSSRRTQYHAGCCRFCDN